MLGRIVRHLPATMRKGLFKTGYFAITLIFYHFRSNTDKDIFVFSTRRGGSTLLGQIISANPGIRNIDQPLTAYAPHGVGGALRQKVTEKFLPEKKYSQYTSLSENDKEKINEYITLLIKGRVSLSTWLEYKASRKKMFFFTDRVMLKFTDANTIIDWFVANFDSHVVYLIRHPIANAYSIMKNNWTITASAYLDDEYFCEKYLTEEQVALSKEIIESKNYFQQAILNWCLENLVPLNFSEQKFLTLTYEELVICPEETIELLSARFNLKEKGRMLHVSSMPSFSTSLSENKTVKSIENETSVDGKYRKILNRWRENVSEEELIKANNILHAFNIDAYITDSSIPSDELLHFSTLFMDRISS